MVAATSQKKRNIVVLGARAVGKSSLILQFIEGQFVDSYYPTIANTFQKTIKYKGQEYLCEIMDTAGQDEFTLLAQRTVVGVHGYLFVYSINSRASFESMIGLRDKVLNTAGVPNVRGVLVGNKCDLKHQRQVSIEEAQAVAKEWGCVFIETSAKHAENIDALFDLAIAEIEKGNNVPQEKGTCIVS